MKLGVLAILMSLFTFTSFHMNSLRFGEVAQAKNKCGHGYQQNSYGDCMLIHAGKKPSRHHHFRK